MHSGTAILKNSLLVSLKFIHAAAIQSSRFTAIYPREVKASIHIRTLIAS